MTGTKLIPNLCPENVDIVCVGEAPGEEEERNGQPFWPEAPAGEKLAEVLQRQGKFRGDVGLCNLSNHRPAGNKFYSLLGTPELEAGLKRLTADLKRTRPNVIAAMGAWPLWYLTGKCNKPRGKPVKGTGIENYRGSILPCTIPGLEGSKVIATYHPSYVARNPTKYSTFDIDFARVVSDSKFPELRLPKREMIIDPRGLELKKWVDIIIKSGLATADIESIKYTPHILCYGFATSPEQCICIVNHDSPEFMWAVNKILSSGIKLIYHGGIFDWIVGELNGFELFKVWWDTMIAQHTQWPELPKTLAYLTSTNTREPYYKDEGKEGEDTKGWSSKIIREILWKYNCKDTGTTFESQIIQEDEITNGPAGWRTTFDFEMSELPMTVDISLTGMGRDEKRTKILKGVLLYQWADWQTELNKLVGRSLNVNSNPQMCKLLYDELGLKEKRKRDKHGKYVRTADEDALVALVGECKAKYESYVQTDVKNRWLKNLLICKITIKIRGIRKVLSSYISVEISADGKARSFVKLTGAETGRWSMAKFIDNTGMNLQTLPREPVELEDETILEKIDILLDLEKALKGK